MVSENVAAYETVELVVDVPPNEWLNQNSLPRHPMALSTRVKALRRRARFLALSARLPRFTGRVRVDYHVATRTRTRFDPANAYPTVKALVDGLTDAGVWVDDDDQHLQGPFPHRDPVDASQSPGWHRVRLTVSGPTGPATSKSSKIKEDQ